MGERLSAFGRRPPRSSRNRHSRPPIRGLGEDELIALADSFAFENCVVRESLRDQLSAA